MQYFKIQTCDNERNLEELDVCEDERNLEDLDICEDERERTWDELDVCEDERNTRKEDEDELDTCEAHGGADRDVDGRDNVWSGDRDLGESTGSSSTHASQGCEALPGGSEPWFSFEAMRGLSEGPHCIGNVFGTVMSWELEKSLSLTSARNGIPFGIECFYSLLRQNTQLRGSRFESLFIWE